MGVGNLRHFRELWVYRGVMDLAIQAVERTKSYANNFIFITLTVAVLIFGSTVAATGNNRPVGVNGDAIVAETGQWEFERECEYPDIFSVGRMIHRSNASRKKVHRQFGCTAGYAAKPGHVKYSGVNIPGNGDARIKIRYSKNSTDNVPIKIYVVGQLRAAFQPRNLMDWNAFTSTDWIELGYIEKGTHSFRLSTQGQQYGVADLDKMTLSVQSSKGAFDPSVLLPLLLEGATETGWTENHSYKTKCAEEDNVNIPIMAPGMTHFKITATHPEYNIGKDNCEPNWDNCDLSNDDVTLAGDVCKTLHDDGTSVVKGCTVTGWWRPYKMKIAVKNGSAGSFHYLIMHQKISNEDSWPQFLVLYEDGNMRIKPHPPAGRQDTGS